MRTCGPGFRRVCLCGASSASSPHSAAFLVSLHTQNFVGETRSKLDTEVQADRGFAEGLGAGMAGAIVGMIGLAIILKSW